MDRNRRGRSPTPPPPPPPLAPGSQDQLVILIQNMMTMIQQQQQQQNQQFMAQQQQQNQQFLERLIPQSAPTNVGLAKQDRPVQNHRELKLHEFTKLASKFNGRSSDPADAEFWMNEIEKAFRASETPEDMKVPLLEYQLKERVNDWWVAMKPTIRAEELN